MIFKINKKSDIKDSELTEKSIYEEFSKIRKKLTRRDILKIAILSPITFNMMNAKENNIKEKIKFTVDNKYDIKMEPDELTPYRKATSYNNFYEFGMGKSDPSKYKELGNKILNPDSWNVIIDGLVEKKIEISLEKILSKIPLIERNYHFRCVETWSMNLPFIGFQLSKLLNLVKPLSSAKYVEFTTLSDKRMPGHGTLGNVKFPYKEALRIDEAMHDLTLLVVGMYGEWMLPQNGAPLRLIVPWKYGFKSIKSIVKITFIDKMPKSTWMGIAQNEYGFYANVNPNVPHPRWSQAIENFIGNSFFNSSMETKLFNGYEDEVAYLYKNLNLKVNY